MTTSVLHEFSRQGTIQYGYIRALVALTLALDDVEFLGAQGQTSKPDARAAQRATAVKTGRIGRDHSALQ